MKPHLTLTVISTLIFLMQFSINAGAPIPEQLPDPDNTKAPDKTKPVKVYILSGQSNMVGMGQINQTGQTAYPTYVSEEKGAEKGCIVSVYKGKYDPSADYSKQEPAETFQEKVGYWPHKSFSEFEEPCVMIARGFINIKTPGEYNFMSGNILKVDDKVIFRNEPDKEKVVVDIKLDKGFHKLEVIHFGRGKTNMSYKFLTVPGTLTTLVKKEGKFPHLLDENGEWTVRNDVIYKGVVSATGQGPLKPGRQRGGTFGPELGFGHVMGYYYDQPVLLIKASIGNRSLAWDILPPGSPRFSYEGKEYPGYKETYFKADPKDNKSMDKNKIVPFEKGGRCLQWYAGKQYDEYTKAINDVLNNFDTLFPDFKDQGYEIAGFVWWQGHKDGGDPGHIAKYEENLTNLIKAWRKEFKAPKAPWVIATVGFGGDKLSDQYVKILEAQKAVSDPEKHPELAGTVTTIDTRPFWREVEESPKNQDYHYNRNAETYYLVGDALGRAMVKLKEGEK